MKDTTIANEKKINQRHGWFAQNRKNKELKALQEEETKQKELENIKIKEWEEKFDREKKLKEQEEIRREQRLRQKELEKIRRLDELENQSNNLNIDLEKFEVDKTKEH